MTARIVVSCDGHRHGQKCRGALFTTPDGSEGAVAAVEYAHTAGWRHGHDADGWPLDLCPSAGHDEEQNRSP